MRTGLITFHFAHHYGAQLQALATMRAIQSLGHDCEIIDYRLPHTTRTNQLFKKSGGVRGMASDAHTALHYGAFQRRFRRFEAFVAEEMSRAATRSGTPISSRTSSLTPPSCWASSGRAAASPTPPAWACLSCRRTRPRSCAAF